MLKKIGTVASSMGLVLASAGSALAQILATTPGQVTATGFGDLGSVINKIFNFVIILAGIIFVILFLVGGVQYLTAAGNEEQTGKAKRLLVDAIVGLVIVLAAWAIGNFVLKQLNLQITNF